MLPVREYEMQVTFQRFRMGQSINAAKGLQKKLKHQQNHGRLLNQRSGTGFQDIKIQSKPQRKTVKFSSWRVENN